MQDRPTVGEILETLETFCDEELLPALSGPLQYRVRVAANLVKILRREVELAAVHDAEEKQCLRRLLDDPSDDLTALNARLADAIARGRFDADDAPLWQALYATTRNKLAVVRPGYDSYDGSIEAP